MVRMGRFVRVIVGACVLEAAGAVPVFVDMEGVKIAGAFRLYIGKTEDFRLYQYAAVIGAVKLYKAA